MCPEKLDHIRYKAVFKTDGTVHTYGGRLALGAESLRVLRNTANSVQVISAGAPVSLRLNQIYELFDDDDFNSNDPNFDGDRDEEVTPLPDTYRLMLSDGYTPQNLYAAAYIEPEYFWAESKGFNQTNATFVLNVAEAGSDAVINAIRNSNDLERDDFWVGYLIIGYQGEISEDYDSDNEAATGGIGASGRFTDDASNSQSVPRGNDGAVIYIEVMRDFDTDTTVSGFIPDLRTRTAPHEMGHEFGLLGDDINQNFGIMNSPIRTRQDPAVFVPRHINVMRWRISSPGK